MAKHPRAAQLNIPASLSMKPRFQSHYCLRRVRSRRGELRREVRRRRTLRDAPFMGILAPRMFDTIHFLCERPLKCFVRQKLEKSGVYRDDKWKITMEEKLDHSETCQVKRLELTSLRFEKALWARGRDSTVEFVRTQLPCMLHETNGYMLSNQGEMDEAMENLHKELDAVTDRGIPWKDTVRLDVGLNLPVNPGPILNCMRNVRVFGLHRWPKVFENDCEIPLQVSEPQTVEWQGKEVWLSFYNKSRQQARKSMFPQQEDGCLRIELKLLTKKRIAKFLGGSVEANGLAVAKLDFFQLYRCFRAKMMQLPSFNVIKTPCKLKQLLAASIKEGWTIEGQPVMDWYRESVSQANFARASKEITSVALSLISFNWGDVLPRLAPPELVHVDQFGKCIPVFDPSWGVHQRIVSDNQGYRLEAVN